MGKDQLYKGEGGNTIYGQALIKLESEFAIQGDFLAFQSAFHIPQSAIDWVRSIFDLGGHIGYNFGYVEPVDSLSSRRVDEEIPSSPDAGDLGSHLPDHRRVGGHWTLQLLFG
jgi:hypothetical protein